MRGQKMECGADGNGCYAKLQSMMSIEQCSGNVATLLNSDGDSIASSMYRSNGSSATVDHNPFPSSVRND
jgi:hypothetical protein